MAGSLVRLCSPLFQSSSGSEDFQARISIAEAILTLVDQKLFAQAQKEIGRLLERWQVGGGIAATSSFLLSGLPTPRLTPVFP